MTAADFPRGLGASEMLRAGSSASTLTIGAQRKWPEAKRHYKRPICGAALNLLLCGLLLASSAKAGVWTPLNWADDSSLSFITSESVTHSGDFGSAASINGFTFETIGIASGTGTFSSPYAGSIWTSTDLSLWTEDKGATQEVIDLWKGIETVEATLSSMLLDSPSLFVKVKADIPTP